MKMNTTTLAGVRMGENFKNDLYAPLELKEFVSNESRLENGKRVIVRNPKKASRTLTLEFLVTGSTEVAFNTNLQAVYTELYKGTVDLEVPELGNEVFHLIYLGKSPSYSSGLSKRACKFKVSFEEPNPADRTAHTP